MKFFEYIGEIFYKVLIALPSNAITGLFPTAFGILVFILRFILEMIAIIFTKVLPFVLIYFGVPLFVLGLLFGFMFVGGQMLLFVVLIGGTYYAIKYLFTDNFKVKDIVNNKNVQNKIKIKAQ